jgi:anthranilate phosphoribosyltransferase
LLLAMMKGEITHVQIAALLTALRMKGETIDEILGFITAMRENMLSIQSDSHAIDVCGTGGDGKGTFNISTAVAFIVAGCGVQVVKHGNRAASSKSGSADVLEALGVKIDLNQEQSQTVLKNVGMVFLFAPLFHPSMKQVSLVRKELKIRTIFNFLGPFANPASVKRQLIGVPNLAIAETLAEVGKKLGYEHLIIVTSEDGLDEISISSKTHMFEIQKNGFIKSVLDPKEFGLQICSPKEIVGGDAKGNASLMQDLFAGKKGAIRDVVVLNSAVALLIAGKVKNITEGIVLAQESIDTGKAKQVLDQLIQETQLYA